MHIVEYKLKKLMIRGLSLFIIVSWIFILANCDVTSEQDKLYNQPMDIVCDNITSYSPIIHNFTIEQNISSTLFFINWSRPDKDLILTLVAPDGTRIDQNVESTSIQYEKRLNYEFYVLQNPIAGIWSVEIRPLRIPKEGMDYCLRSIKYKKENVTEEEIPNGVHFNETTYKAKLTDNYLNRVIDTNGDKLYDFLIIDIGINIYIPGEYSLVGSLYDPKGEEVSWSTDRGNLSVGSHTMHLNFDGKSIKKHRANGPYRLKNLTLVKGSSDKTLQLCDFKEDTNCIVAYNYTEFA